MYYDDASEKIKNEVLRHNLDQFSSISRDLSPPGYNSPSTIYNSSNSKLVEESKASP
ncbi:hypothetical protein P3S68_032930 [Capsicum galapagoense]